MKTVVDYLIVGSGLTGAVIARVLFDAGREVLVLERRNHVGGNVHDHVHPSGIPIHTYGPHYFRTNSEKLWEFANRFAKFYPYEAIVKTFVDGKYENWPIKQSYLVDTVGIDWKPEYTGNAPQNFEEACLSMMPRVIYEKFVKGYTEKQWGVPAKTLSPRLARRFEVRNNNDPRLKTEKFQGLPEHGYTYWMQNMLKNIPIMLNVDFLTQRSLFTPKKLLVFTGPIDEFFDFDLGRLLYRGQKREHTYIPNKNYAQPCGQINNPDPHYGPHIRTLEWKHMMLPEFANSISGTVLTRETPYTPNNPNNYEYPFPDQRNRRLYRRYRDRAEALSNLLICGRLGEYRYYDMDQAIARAFVLAQQILKNT